MHGGIENLPLMLSRNWTRWNSACIYAHDSTELNFHKTTIKKKIILSWTSLSARMFFLYFFYSGYSCFLFSHSWLWIHMFTFFTQGYRLTYFHFIIWWREEAKGQDVMRYHTHSAGEVSRPITCDKIDY